MSLESHVDVEHLGPPRDEYGRHGSHVQKFPAQGGAFRRSLCLTTHWRFSVKGKTLIALLWNPDKPGGKRWEQVVKRVCYELWSDNVSWKDTRKCIQFIKVTHFLELRNYLILFIGKSLDDKIIHTVSTCCKSIHNAGVLNNWVTWRFKRWKMQGMIQEYIYNIISSCYYVPWIKTSSTWGHTDLYIVSLVLWVGALTFLKQVPQEGKSWRTSREYR